MNKASKLRWWVLFNSILMGLLAAVYNGAASFAWTHDATKISFITLAVFAIMTAFVGYLTIIADRPGRDMRQDKRYINACWFGSELLMGMGLTGTILGIIMMFVGSSSGLDPSNINAMKTTISTMSLGLTTCFITSLAGVVTSQLIKLQLVNYEVNRDEDDD